MIYRSRAPLRIGLAGGGTDLASYADKHGGAILNATISMYAYASIKPRNDGKIIISSIDHKTRIELDSQMHLEINGEMSLAKGVYNRIVKDFVKKPLSFELTTYVDAPAGSGLGSSSTLVVAMVGAFAEWQQIALGEYDVARLAYSIERVDLNMAGGKQDQYAATFGGVNFMEFYDQDRVLVNPLRIKKDYLSELEMNILLYYTGTSRLSSKIIDDQVSSVQSKSEKSLEAMQNLKLQAADMKEALLTGKFYKIGKILEFGWQSKKQTAASISNSTIDSIYQKAIHAGATGGKISGAGGGGFMMFYCPENSRYNVIEALKEFGGEFRRFQFTKEGLTTWSTKSEDSL